MWLLFAFLRVACCAGQRRTHALLPVRATRRKNFFAKKVRFAGESASLLEAVGGVFARLTCTAQNGCAFVGGVGEKTIDPYLSPLRPSPKTIPLYLSISINLYI
jgi:hypothetical protein